VSYPWKKKSQDSRAHRAPARTVARAALGPGAPALSALMLPLITHTLRLSARQAEGRPWGPAGDGDGGGGDAGVERGEGEGEGGGWGL